MLTYFVISLYVSLAMSFANLLNSRFRADYEKQYSLGMTNVNWSTLTLLSMIFGTVFGTFTAYCMQLSNLPQNIIYFNILGAVIGYISTQAYYQDFLFSRVDSWVLRIGYLIVLILSTAYTFTQFKGFSFFVALYMLIFLYLSLILVFLFSTVGASDVRGLAILLPFMFVVNNTLGLFAFVLSLVYSSIFLSLYHKKHGKRTSMPVLPYIIFPYLIIIPLYGVFLNTLSKYTI